MRKSLYLFVFLTFVLTKTKGQTVASFFYDPPVTGVFCNPSQVFFHSTSTGSGAVTLKWNFGESPGTQSVITNPSYWYFNPGTFTITLIATSSGESDTTTQQITINQTPFPMFGMDDTTVCEGTPIEFKDFSFLNGNYATYSWNFSDPSSGSANTDTAQNPFHTFYQVGNYNVVMVITSSQGCTATANNNVYITQGINVTAAYDTFICNGTLAYIYAVGATQYSWSPGATLTDSTIVNPFANPTSTTTYTVIGSDGNGCSATDSVSVYLITNGTANAGTDQTICNGTNIGLQASGLTTYSWSPATGLDDPNISNPTASPNSTQVYVVSGPDNSGCTVSDTVIVFVTPIPTADAGQDIIVCEDQSTYLLGSGGNTFQWQPSNGLLNANSFLAFANPDSTTTYTLTVSNGTNCTATDQVVVNVLAKPILITSGNAIICPGNSTQLTANGAASYTWTPSGGLSQSNISDPIALLGIDMSYVVTGIGPNGCSDTAHVNVNVKIPDDLVAAPGGTVCAGEQIQLFATGMQSYEWFPQTGLDNPFVPEPYANPPQSITYKVKGFDGCYYDSAYVEVKINDIPPVSAGPDQITLPDNPVQLQATGNGSYYWYPATGLDCSTCSEPMATVNETTTYVVTNYNADGCKTEDTVVVYVNCIDAVIFVPNAFTPNGDGKNEKFYVRTKGLKHLDNFRIYTRTGQLVFESNNVDEGWDGTYNGYKLPPAVFSYYVSATCNQGESITYVGNVTLIR